jgi:hypothetical protein
LHPKALSPLQEEMMSHNYQLHHLPFSQLIIMAESGEIPRRLASLKDAVQFVFHVYLVKHTHILGDLNPRRFTIFGKSWMIIRVQELLWIILSLHNQV